MTVLSDSTVINLKVLLVLVAMALPPAWAGDSRPDPDDARRNLRLHAHAWRTTPSLFGQRAALISNTLAETSALLDRLPIGRDNQRQQQVSLMRQQLSLAAQNIEADFTGIETRLARLGVPEKAQAWHAFVRDFRARMARADAALATLQADVATLTPQQYRRRAAALQAILGTSSIEKPASTVARFRSTRQPVTSIPNSQPNSNSSHHAFGVNEGPTPADLAESRAVALTPDIRDKAAQLGKDPVRIYNWVSTHTEYLPAIGHLQSSQAALFSGRGNDFDQSTLLIALLRASDIPARYVAADVVMPRADVREWLGVKDETVLLSLLGSSPAFLLFPTVDKDRVVATRVWVEAFLESQSGKRWLTMDPARKKRTFQEGVVLDYPVYDRMSYLRALKPVPPGEAYLDTLRGKFQKTFPGRAFAETAFSGEIRQPAPPATELEYPITKLHFREAEVPSNFRHRIRLTLSGVSGRPAYLNLDLVLPEMIPQPLTLSFSPASTADQKVVEAFGAITRAPAALVNLVPEFRLGDVVVARGSTPIPLGTALDLSVNHTPPVPAEYAYVNVNHHAFTAGETAALVLNAHMTGAGMVAKRISILVNRLATASTDEATRLMLDLAALRYLQRVEFDEQQLSGPLQVRFFPDDEVGNAITFASLDSQTLFDRPFVVTPGRLQIHAWPTCLPYVDLNHNHHNDPVIKTAWQLHNDAISVLEHEIWEELVMIPSVSTIKILQAAVRENNPIHIITSANAKTEINTLEVPQAIKDMLTARVSAGAVLTVPRRTLSLGAWKGTGWIEEFANWDFNYIIFDLALLSPGGDTGGAPAPPRPPQNEPGTVGEPGPLHNTTCSDPVNVANGNLFEQTADLVLAAQGQGIIFQRTYNSLLLAAGPLGPGWIHSYQISLQRKDSSIVFQDGSGTSLTFLQDGEGWVSPAGYYLTIKQDAQGYVLRTKHGRESRFDERGVLQSLADRNRNTLEFSYSNEKLHRIGDRAGHTLLLQYDGGGRLSAIEDFTGRRVVYEYDGSERLTAVTDAAGARTTYSYFADRIFNHLLKSITSAEARITSFEYYGNGKVSRVKLPGGQTTSFLYLPLRNETHVIDTRGLLTTYQFNALGNVVRIVQPDGNYLDRIYDSAAGVLSQTDAEGNTSRYAYDTSGNLTARTDPQGRTLGFTYDPKFNLVTSARDASGNESRFEYDERGNLLRSVRPDGGETAFKWDESGRLLSRTDAEGNTVTIDYDQAGNPTTVTDALGNATRQEFDALKRLTRAVDASGAEVTQEYDVLDRRVSQTGSTGRTSKASYDGEGRLTSHTDAARRTAKFSYDAMNHLAQVTDPMRQLTEYGYAAPEYGCPSTSNLAQFRDASGYTRNHAFDFLERLTSTSDALGNTTQYGYDGAGRLAFKRDANGAAIRYEHDAAGHVTRKVYADGSDARFAYDDSNNLVSASNQHVTYTFTYDSMNRLKSAKDSRFGKSLTYTYDRLGRRTSLSDFEGGIFRYSWDAASRLAAIQNPAGSSVAFFYDSLGRTNTVTYSNRTAADYRYDEAGRLVSIVHGVAGGTQPLAFGYEYDEAGNVSAISDQAGRHTYRFDSLDRLMSAQHPSSMESFDFDAAGNRTAAEGKSYTYDAAGRLTATDVAGFVYDRNGNLIVKTSAVGTTRYAWDGDNQLVRISLPDGSIVSYRYDALGRRIEKNVNGTMTAYVYDLSAILLEVGATGAVQARYTHGVGVDQPLIVERDGRQYFHHADLGSNVVLWTDEAGEAACASSYDSFGRTQTCQNSPSPYGFAAREYDAETGLYYMRARFYDPSIGRFLSPDPFDLANLLLTQQNPRAGLALLPAASAALAGRRSLSALRGPQQLNLYSYALNNPNSYRDPSGLSCAVHVQIGWVSGGGGATTDGPVQFSGTVNGFNHWLQANHYSVSYTEGSFAEITDLNTGHVVGVVSASQVGFTEVPYHASPSLLSTEFWQTLGQGVSDVGQSLVQNFQAAQQVPWHRLQGQEYWDAANNPQNYIRR